MSDYYADLDKLRAAGQAYAESAIESGEDVPTYELFSGEFADGLTPQDALDKAGLTASFAQLEDFEQTDVVDHFTDGYLQAAWPGL